MEDQFKIEIGEAIRSYYRGEIFDAEKILRKILAIDPVNTKALYRYAAVQKDLGRPDEAAESYLLLAKIFMGEKLWQEAYEVSQKASGCGAVAGDTALLAGECLFNLKRYGEALEQFLHLPDSYQALLYAGKCCFNLKEYEDALTYFRKAMDQTEDSENIFKAYYWVGKALYAIGDMESARKCFESYQSFFPGDPVSTLDLALCCFDSGLYDQAREFFLKLLESEPDHFLANLYLGIAGYRLRLFDDSLKYINASLEIEDHPVAHYWKGLVFYEQRRYSDALACFDRARALDNKPVFYKMMGNTFLKLGEVGNAKICYEKAAGLDPGDSELKKLIEHTKRLM